MKRPVRASLLLTRGTIPGPIHKGRERSADAIIRVIRVALRGGNWRIREPALLHELACGGLAHATCATSLWESSVRSAIPPCGIAQRCPGFSSCVRSGMGRSLDAAQAHAAPNGA